MKNAMKNKTKFSILLSLMFAFVLSFALAFSLPVASKNAIAEGESGAEKIEINFVNKADIVLNGEDEYLGDIYYNQTENQLEDDENQRIDLTVITNDALFSYWNVYNASATNGFSQLGADYGASFNLLNLVSSIFAGTNKNDYLIDGKISLLSVRENNTKLIVDETVNEFGKLYVSGVLVSSEIILDYNTEYSFKIVPTNNYSLKNVKIYSGMDKDLGNEPKNTFLTQSFNFTTSTISSYQAVAEYEKVNNTVNFIAVDRSLVAYSDMNVSSYLDIVSTTGKVSETLKDKVAISSDNSFRFYKCRIKNNVTNEYDDFDLLSVQENNEVFGADFYDKYAKNGIVDVYVVFDRLYQVKVSLNGEGEFTAYVNHSPVNAELIVNGVLTTYVSSFDTMEIYALPGEGSIIERIENVNNSELENGKVTLQELSENREIKIVFDKEFYLLKVYAFDNKDERITQYDNNSIIYVNNVKTNKIRLGDKISRIETVEGALNSNYQISEYFIFNKEANRFISFSEGLEFDASYISEGTEKVLYVKAVYNRLYKVSVYIDSLSAGSGYFTVEVKDRAFVLQKRYRNVTTFNLTLPAGYRIYVTAEAYRGYTFSKFTLENTNPSDHNIISKSVENEDVSLGLVYEKTNVSVKINSSSENAKTQTLSSNNVQIGDKITISYKLDFSYELKNVYINKVRADKLGNVKVDDNSIVIDVTKEFLNSLDKDFNVNVDVKTVRDGSYISFVVVIPIILVLIAGACAVSIVYFVKAKKKRDEIVKTEINNK